VISQSSIFIDANVPMYLVGAPHPNRERSAAMLDACIRRGVRLVSDAEVLQEIVHRYTAIGRIDLIGPCLDTLLEVADEILPIAGEDVLDARRLLLEYPAISARDAVHVAVMRHHGVQRILSFDQGFDQVPGIERLR
jgi:predicted nucleic acid-binding protein